MNAALAAREDGCLGRLAPHLSVIVVNWNTARLLEACLESIYQHQLRSPFEVIVVDNASTDGSRDMLERRFPQALVLENSQNVGFAEAANQGARLARGTVILLLNSDTLVNAPSLDALVDFICQTPDAGAAGGQLFNTNGSFQGGYAHFSCLLQELLIALRVGDILWPGYPSHGKASTTRPVDWLSGACLAIRRDPFIELGGLDQEYFMYGEEVDLQFRLKRAGWKVYYLPHVHTIHLGGGSQDRWRRRTMVYRGKVLFYRKHYGPWTEFCLRTLFAAISLSKIVCWAAVLVMPQYAQRARKELQSNCDILQLCWQL